MRRAARRKKAFRPRTTLPGQGAAPNLIKELELSVPNQVWVSDITYGYIGGMAIPGRDSGPVQPQGGGLETGRKFGGRTGCYGARERLGFAPAGGGPVLSLRSRQPVQQPSRTQTLECYRGQSEHEWVRKLLGGQ